MKKNYQRPQVKVVRTQCVSMLCGSTEKVGVRKNVYDNDCWDEM